jgi:hypothetical protein
MDVGIFDIHCDGEADRYRSGLIMAGPKPPRSAPAFNTYATHVQFLCMVMLQAQLAHSAEESAKLSEIGAQYPLAEEIEKKIATFKRDTLVLLGSGKQFSNAHASDMVYTEDYSKVHPWDEADAGEWRGLIQSLQLISFNMGRFRPDMLGELQGYSKQASQTYERYKRASLFLYGFGWLLGLLGRLFQIKQLDAGGE